MLPAASALPRWHGTVRGLHAWRFAPSSCIWPTACIWPVPCRPHSRSIWTRGRWGRSSPAACRRRRRQPPCRRRPRSSCSSGVASQRAPAIRRSTPTGCCCDHSMLQTAAPMRLLSPAASRRGCNNVHGQTHNCRCGRLQPQQLRPRKLSLKVQPAGQLQQQTSKIPRIWCWFQRHRASAALLMTNTASVAHDVPEPPDSTAYCNMSNEGMSAHMPKPSCTEPVPTNHVIRGVGLGTLHRNKPEHTCRPDLQRRSFFASDLAFTGSCMPSKTGQRCSSSTACERGDTSRALSISASKQHAEFRQLQLHTLLVPLIIATFWQLPEGI